MSEPFEKALLFYWLAGDVITDGKNMIFFFLLDRYPISEGLEEVVNENKHY